MSCPDCFRGAAHNHAEPKGTIETIHGIRTYVAGGSDPARSKSAIIYLPDGFSLKLVNNKLLADEYAAGTGCKVYIPDVVVSLSSLHHSIAFPSLALPSPTPSSSKPRTFHHLLLRSLKKRWEGRGPGAKTRRALSLTHPLPLTLISFINANQHRYLV